MKVVVAVEHELAVAAEDTDEDTVAPAHDEAIAIRAVPHVIGNWATHVYVEVVYSARQWSCLEDVVIAAADGIDADTTVHSLLSATTMPAMASAVALSTSSTAATSSTTAAPSTMAVELPPQCLHVSLSRTLYLKLHQIDAFTARLGRQLQNERAFRMAFAGISAYVNDQRTRSFIGHDVGFGADGVGISVCDLNSG